MTAAFEDSFLKEHAGNVAIQGRQDPAVALLRSAFAEGREFDLWLHRDLDLESLRAFPAFVTLTRPKP